MLFSDTHMQPSVGNSCCLRYLSLQSSPDADARVEDGETWSCPGCKSQFLLHRLIWKPTGVVAAETPRKFKTNVEKVTEFMEFGSPLNQAFVMEACNRYSAELLKDMNAVRKSMKNSFINADAWLDCAQNWKDKTK